MSELINNADHRKSILRDLLLRLHAGESPETLKAVLESQMEAMPPGEVLEVEQALISEGVEVSEILHHCDAHSEVLKGGLRATDLETFPAGHPVDVFLQENHALTDLCDRLEALLNAGDAVASGLAAAPRIEVLTLWHQLMDVDKHYLRKEYLLFPFLEAHGFPGPSKVMWGKHDQIREQLKAGDAILVEDLAAEDFSGCLELVLRPALVAVREMVHKEEHILLPVSREKLAESEWAQIHEQTMDYGYCLVEPRADWKPTQAPDRPGEDKAATDGFVQLPSGRFSVQELEAVLNALPVDMTFVDKDDKVKYFSLGRDRIFSRSKAILGRDVRHCHPPASAHIVEKILEDFRHGRASRAPFWIQMGPKFVHIEYFALRSPDGQYLGCLEVSQDLAGYRALEGEQRILSYREEVTE